MHLATASNASSITCLPAWDGTLFGLKSHLYFPIFLTLPPLNRCTYCSGIFYKPEVNLILAGKCNSCTDVARWQTTCIPCAVRVEAKELSRASNSPQKWAGWGFPSSCFPSLQSTGFPWRKAGTASLDRFISSPPVWGTWESKNCSQWGDVRGPWDNCICFSPEHKIARTSLFFWTEGWKTMAHIPNWASHPFL